MLKSCSRCLYKSNHPFGLSFLNNECSGCFTHKEKDELDWSERKSLLEAKIRKFKKKTKKYDCVVPVVGDAEDFFVLSKVLDLGLAPLVVGVNDYFKNDIGWQNLHQLITYFDVDSFVFNPDITAYKELVRTSLRKYNHILLPFLMLHSSFPVHVAYERRIPMVIWGQHQSIEQAGKFSHIDEVQMSSWSREQHDLFQVDIKKLTGNGAQIQDKYLNYYNYPKISSLSSRGTTGIYLSNYFRWDPLKQNASTINFGFQPEYNTSTFDIYERAGSSVYYDFHDILKFKRVGYRKITDHLSREIRHNRISRQDSLAIEKVFSNNKVNIEGFFQWLEVSKTGYDWFLDHKIPDLKFLVNNSSNSNRIDVKIPESIKKLLKNEKRSSEKFLIYDKGIDI